VDNQAGNVGQWGSTPRMRQHKGLDINTKLCYDNSMKKDLFKQCYDLWGENSQLNQTIEECSELIKAITKWNRGIGTKEQMAEEVADVELMCQELRFILGDKLVNKYRRAKIKHVKELLDEGNPEP
jgi:NTP pyrophosphatase (non-canonical NTP hydrolase)